MLSEYLKTNSRKDHDSIEGSVDLVSLASRPDTYLQMLKAMYGYYLPLEKAFIPFRDDFSKIGIDLNQRLKLEILSDDIKQFNVSQSQINDLPVCHKLPEMKNIFQAMGVLYVLEGSTMGGQIIFKNLLKHNIISEGRAGGNFFKPYGQDTMPMWMKFKESLNFLDAKDDEAVLNSARATFNTMEVWLTTSVK